MTVLAGVLALLGMAGVAVALVMMIVQSVFKRGWAKKRVWTVGVVSLSLFVVGVVMGVSSVPDDYEAKQQAERNETTIDKMSVPEKPATPSPETETTESTAPAKSPQEQQETESEGRNAPGEPKSYKEWLKVTVEKEIGAESNLDSPRIAGIDFDKGDESKPMLSLVADDNITLNLVRVGMLSDATDVFKTIFADDRAKVVTIVWGRPTTDEYGNTKMSAVMAIQMSRDTANTINWKNFTYSNLPKAADDFYEAPKSAW